MGRKPIVDGQVTQARRDADAAVARNHAASETRLKALLCLAPAERFAHLDDADLRPEHRTALRRSLRPHLRRSRRRLPRLWPWPRRARLRAWTSRLLAALAAFEISVPVALALAWAIMTWHNTTHWMVLTRAVQFDVTRAGGTTEPYTAGPGKTIVRYGWDGVPRTTLALRDGTWIAVALSSADLRPLP
ncbi:hypothetical protein SAMN05216360_12356 [Methylobacterium phyllostachyos]|uniref:Uncharacterized protein n=1 Tax=Methylobacterium phyllostachyos TaxID=582672 RepID=A0A1H0JRK7_9HYPH|nr:hypothetical protein [Methylobacterium phyllostachyos]SDO46041.1 hypothetical protein SAMN05216360_12356 [Methylobacterium phyllostachyos]